MYIPMKIGSITRQIDFCAWAPADLLGGANLGNQRVGCYSILIYQPSSVFQICRCSTRHRDRDIDLGPTCLTSPHGQLFPSPHLMKNPPRLTADA